MRIQELRDQIGSDLMQLMHSTPRARAGKVGYAIAWLLGVPLPILVIVYLIRSC